MGELHAIADLFDGNTNAFAILLLAWQENNERLISDLRTGELRQQFFYTQRKDAQTRKRQRQPSPVSILINALSDERTRIPTHPHR